MTPLLWLLFSLLAMKALIRETTSSLVCWKHVSDICAIVCSNLLKPSPYFLRLTEHTKKKSSDLLQHLVEFYLPRIIHHAHSFHEYFNSADSSAIHGPRTLEQSTLLHSLDGFLRSCHTFRKKQPPDISIARSITAEARKLVKSRAMFRALLSCYERDTAFNIVRHLRFLGRIRTFHQTLCQCAKALPNFVNFNILLIAPPQCRKLPGIDFESSLRNVEYILDRSLILHGKDIKFMSSNYYKKLIIHAEMQNIFFLSRPENSQLSLFPYIGISKRPCYMCDIVLKADGRFKTKASHGQIHPNWTLPRSQAISSNLAIGMHRAFSSLSGNLRQLICDPSGRRYDQRPESTTASSVVCAAYPSDSPRCEKLVHGAKARKVRQVKATASKVSLHDGQVMRS